MLYSIILSLSKRLRADAQMFFGVLIRLEQGFLDFPVLWTLYRFPLIPQTPSPVIPHIAGLMGYSEVTFKSVMFTKRKHIYTIKSIIKST
jgi:hypothetical protein